MTGWRTGLGTTPPMIDAMMIGRKAVLDSPEKGLSAAACVDPSVDCPDVGFHGVRAQIGHRADLGVAFALRDERQDLRLAITKSFYPARPVEPVGASRSRRNFPATHFAAVNRLQCGHQLA